MKVIIEIIVYGLSLYLAYLLYKKYYKTINIYIDEAINDWIDIPNWINRGLGIFLFVGCIFAQVTLFFESIVIWLFLLIIMPFFYLPIKNKQAYNFLSVTTFFITAFFAITLFFSVDNSRDIIGETFISDYDVYYTTEYVQRDYGEDEIEVAHVNTGNDNLDFVLESIFPFGYRIIIGFIVIFSLLMNISLKEKNKLIRTEILK